MSDNDMVYSDQDSDFRSRRRSISRSTSRSRSRGRHTRTRRSTSRSKRRYSKSTSESRSPARLRDDTDRSRSRSNTRTMSSSESSGSKSESEESGKIRRRKKSKKAKSKESRRKRKSKSDSKSGGKKRKPSKSSKRKKRDESSSESKSSSSESDSQSEFDPVDETFVPQGKLYPNIYERPVGPRTGIGYPEADIIEVRFMVPLKISGSIIGRRGEYVGKLRKDFSIGIGIPDSMDKIDRIVVIRGGSVRNVIDCTVAVADYPLRAELQKGLNLDKGITEIRLLMHHSICGSIIGKKGALIKELRETAGTDIHIYGDNCPRSTDRVVRLTGTPIEIRDALAMIFKFTGDQRTKGAERNFNVDWSDHAGVDYGGWKQSEVDKMCIDNPRLLQELDRHGNPRSQNMTEKGQSAPRETSLFGDKKDYFSEQAIGIQSVQHNKTMMQYKPQNQPFKPNPKVNYGTDSLTPEQLIEIYPHYRGAFFGPFYPTRGRQMTRGYPAHRGAASNRGQPHSNFGRGRAQTHVSSFNSRGGHGHHPQTTGRGGYFPRGHPNNPNRGGFNNIKNGYKKKDSSSGSSYSSSSESSSDDDKKRKRKKSYKHVKVRQEDGETVDNSHRYLGKKIGSSGTFRGPLTRTPRFYLPPNLA